MTADIKSWCHLVTIRCYHNFYPLPPLYKTLHHQDQPCCPVLIAKLTSKTNRRRSSYLQTKHSHCPTCLKHNSWLQIPDKPRLLLRCILNFNYLCTSCFSLCFVSRQNSHYNTVHFPNLKFPAVLASSLGDDFTLQRWLITCISLPRLF